MNSVKSVSFYADVDDYHLVLACKKRIEPAFNLLYRKYAPFVRGLLYRLAPDMPECRDDIVQDVFVKVWKSIGALNNPRAFKSWLRQLTTNVFYDELRKRPKAMVISLDEPLKGAQGDDGGCRDIPDNKAQPDESFERNETLLR